MLVAATLVARKPVGTLGGSTSSLGGVVKSTLLLGVETLPAPSTARTWSTYLLLGQVAHGRGGDVATHLGHDVAEVEDAVQRHADVVARRVPRQVDRARLHIAHDAQVARRGRRLGVRREADAKAVDVRSAARGGRRGTNLVGTGIQARLERRVLPGVPAVGEGERQLVADQRAVDRDVPGTVAASGVGVADLEVDGAGGRGYDRPFDEAAGDH